ncbi:Isoaspartyl peptidase/L-asparaginase [Nymphon striatum]|nr:Isoaspartyl peptidase/L-asparaginase [Nymphon striatum]
MLSTHTSVRTRHTPANSPRNSPCPSPHGSPRFIRKSDNFQRTRKPIIPVLIVHGGPWGILDSTSEVSWLETIKQATNEGYEVLNSPESSVAQAVETAVHYLENDSAFIQGMIDTNNHQERMDAIMMEGRKLRIGCVLRIRDVFHPIKVAHQLMKKNEQVTLVGETAEQFAKEMDIIEFSDSQIHHDKSSINQQNHHDIVNNSFGRMPKCIGAVAVDRQGRVACAWASRNTGFGAGTVTPLSSVGSAVFCDDYVGAVSCIGSCGADAIGRVCLARHISGLMQQCGMSAKDAVISGLEYMQNRINGAYGGAVALTNNGDVGIHFTTDRMAWAYRKGEQMKYGVKPREHNDQDCPF